MSEAALTLSAVVDDALDTRYFHPEEGEPIFQGVAYPGDPSFILIVGENASGKSLLFRLIDGLLHREHKATGVTVSIRERTGGGTMEMGRMRQTMMFGDEATSSTGTTSVKTAGTAYRSANKYAEDGKTVAVMLDEPELGLSDSYAYPLGRRIVQHHNDRVDGNLGTVIVTHCRALAEGIRDEMGHDPTFVYMGENPSGSLDAWIKAPARRTIEELETLPDIALARFRATHRLTQPKD